MPNYKHIYVTIKITLKCNLACQYCYGRDNHAQGKQMSIEEIYKGVDFACDYAERVEAKSLTLCWHGGEPFLLINKLPLLIEYANSKFEKHGIKLSHCIQTNATLLTSHTYDIIKRYFNGYVGVSVDLFSNYRTFPNGKVSTDVAIFNIDNALKSGISLGAINLITHDNMNRIADIYDFYKKRKMSVRLARVFPISKEDNLQNPMYLNDEEFAQVMISYFDMWANDYEPAHCPDIVKLIADLLLGKPSLCLREAKCHERYMALSPGGEIYSCAEFDVPEAVIGNFLTQSPEEFIESDTRERFAQMSPVPAECHLCQYERTCHGGCFRERFMLGYPYRCRSNIMYWDHIVKWLESKGTSLYALYGQPRERQIEIINSIYKRT